MAEADTVSPLTDKCRLGQLLFKGAPRTVLGMTREDDASYKLLFSSPEVVRDLVLGPRAGG